MASSCESDFVVLGLQPGEEIITPIRTAATVVIITVTSAWSSLGKIKRLRLFFAHWLSGMVMSLGYVIDDVVVDLCWISSNMEGFIKTIKFIEHTASNMLAITNLAICINLALIVLSHQTMSRVKSLSSSGLILAFLVISAGTAAVSIPFWDDVLVVGTGLWLTSNDEGRSDALNVLTFVVEFIVGVSMLCIVSWLLLFRMGDIKECWKLHRRIRYYFCLTIIGTAVNLGLGICGTINASKDEVNTLLLTWSWVFRYIHIMLDTIVLYGVLRERRMDERGDDERSGTSGLSSEQLSAGRGTGYEGSRRSRQMSKPAAVISLN